MTQDTKNKLTLIRKSMRRKIKSSLYKWKHMNRRKKILLQIGMISLVAGIVAGIFIGKAVESRKADKAMAKKIESVTNNAKKEAQNQIKKATKTQGEGKSGADVPWNLQLISESNPLDPAYAPELTVLTGEYSVDARIADAANQMLEAAKNEGMNMHICSAYRSFDKQTQIFNDTVTQNLNGGVDYLAAYNTTKQSVALPGTSEHGAGLALDIVSDAYAELDDQQAQTAEAQWLAKNCAKFGFILRYPPAKSGETGIIYEPWHYRYVGIEDATKIMAEGITLETYLQK